MGSAYMMLNCTSDATASIRSTRRQDRPKGAADQLGIRHHPGRAQIGDVQFDHLVKSDIRPPGNLPQPSQARQAVQAL